MVMLFMLQAVSTPREVAEISDVIVTGTYFVFHNCFDLFHFRSSYQPPHVNKVFDGPDGLLAGMDSGKVWRNHSTTDHEQVFTEELTKKGGELLECIITGGLEAPGG